jgi:hypothetical protein
MSAVMVSMAVFSFYTRTLSLETVHTALEWNCQMMVLSRIWYGIDAGQL